MRKWLLVYSALVYVNISNAEFTGIVSVMTRGGLVCFSFLLTLLINLVFNRVLLSLLNLETGNDKLN